MTGELRGNAWNTTQTYKSQTSTVFFMVAMLKRNTEQANYRLTTLPATLLGNPDIIEQFLHKVQVNYTVICAHKERKRPRKSRFRTAYQEKWTSL